MTVETIDRRLLCQCRRRWQVPYLGGLDCEYRSTAEDMLCDICRSDRCTTAAFLGAEDVSVHMGPTGCINWDDLDGDCAP